MANTNDFLIQLLAKLDVSSVNKEFEELKKRLTNDPVIQKVTLDTSMSKQAIKSMATEIHNELGKAFKATGIEDFDITVKDVESILSSAVKESNKLAKELESASSKAQKFLAQFNNKSGGTLVNSKEFKAVQDAINGLGKTSSIDDLNKAMNTLETTYNNMVSSLRNSGKSLNPFINAKNEMATMDDTIKGIGLEFEKLTSKPKAVSDAIKQLSIQQSKVNSYTIGTQEWADAYGKLQQMIQKVNSEISNLRKAQSAKVSTQIFNTSDLKNNNIAYMSKVYNTIEKQMVEINRLAKAKDWQIVDVSGVEQADGKIKKLTLTVRDAEGALKKLDMQREKLQGNGKAQYGLMQVGDVKILETASQAQEKLAQSTEKANAKLAEQANKIQISMGVNGETTSKIEVLRNNFTKLGLSADEVKTKMSGVDAEVKTLQSLMNSGAENSAIVSQFEKLQTVLTQTQNNLKQTRSDYSLLATEQQRLSLANTIEAWNQKNTRATKEVRAENDRYVASLRDLNTQMTKIDFNKINNGFKQNENSMRTLNRLGASLKDQMKQAANSFTQWISVSSAIMGVVYSTKQAVSELKEVDTLLTEISKANDQLSKTQLKQIGYNSFDVSGKYGKKATDYLSGVQEASRAGYVNAEGIAELSVAAQGAGDMTAELANQYIIATDKAYKFGGSVEKLTEVLDGSNYITNHNAVNMTELAEGMSIVGSQASSLGVGVDQTTAALGTMIATTQQSGSEMARAFKAILLNIQQVSDEEEGIDAEGLTKYEKACNALNVSLKETKNGVMSLRDPMEVIKDLSEEYTKLDASDIRRTNLLSSVGGKLRSNALNALLENYDMYSKMLEEYSQGTGSMAQEAEKTAKSWEGSMNRLSNTWTKVIGNIANSDAIIGAVNGLNSLLSVIDKITGSLGSLGTIGLGAGLLASFKGAGIFKTISDETTLSGQRIATSFTTRKIAQEEAARQLEIDIQCLKNYEIECQKGTVSTETFATTMNGASVEAQSYATNIKNGTGSAQTFATNQKAIQTSMNGTSVASKAAAVGINLFKAALNTLIFFAVIEGIQLLVKGIDNLILTAEEAEEKAESLRNSMQSFFDEVQSGQQTISSISDRFSELSKHVTETGENIDLTKDEYSEYLDICNQVKSIMPELVTGYTNEGNAIITLKDNVDSLTESYKENIRAKAAAFVTNGDDDGNTIQSFFDDYKIFTEGEGGLFAPSASGLWNNKSTDYEDYYGYDRVHEWLSEVADLSLKDLQNLQKGTTQATYLYALLKENGYELANITEDNYEAVHDVLDTRLTSLEGEMATRVSNVKMSLQQMLYADRDYWDIDNKEALSAIDSLFSSVDAEFIKQNNLLGQTALQSFESNVIRLFDDKNTQQAMIDIYTPQGIEESIEDYSKRVNNAIKNVQDYAKENKIDISLDFGDITGDVENLQKQYNDAIAKAKDKELDFDWNSWFKENSINTQEEIDRWNEIAESATNAADARKKYTEGEEGNETDISWALSDEQSDAIDDFQSNIKKLKDALSSIQSGDLSDSDLVDFIQTFPELQDASGNLEGSIKSLANTLLNDLINLLGDDAPTQLIDSIRGIASEINDINLSPMQQVISSMSSVSDTLSVANSVFKDFKDNTYLTQDSIESLQESFGDLSSFDLFITKVTKVGVTEQELDSALESIINDYLNQTDALDSLTVGTAEYVANVLKEAGVTNSLEVVLSRLGLTLDEYAKVKDYANKKGIDLQNITSSEIVKILEEIGVTQDAITAFANLALAKENTNLATIDTTGDIQNLSNLVKACGGATQAISTLMNAKLLMDEANKGNSSAIAQLEMLTAQSGQTVEQWYASQQRNAQKEIDDALKNGTKYNATVNFTAPNYKYTDTESASGNSGKNESTSEIDFVEKKLNKLSQALDKQKEKAENLYSTYKKQNKELDNTVALIDEQIASYNTAYDTYMSKANSISLDEPTKEKVREGSLTDISTYDSDTAELISQYEEWYNKAQDVKDTISDLKQEQKELFSQRIDNIQDDYDLKTDYQKSLIDLYESELEYRKAIGEDISESDYDYLLEKQKKIKSQLQDEYNAINSEFQSMLDNGDIQKYDDNWYKYKSLLVGIQSELSECDNNILQIKDDARQVKWDNWQKGLDSIQNINDELESLISLHNSDDIYDDDGNYTANGISLLALYQEQLQANEAEIQKYNKAIKMLKKELKKGEITQDEYTESLNEYRYAQYGLASSIKSIKDTLIEFRIEAIEENQKATEEAINSETDKMKELIQSKKEALQAEKDLNDYKESISKKQKNIANLNSKIAQLERSDSAKDQALARELKADLAKEEEALQEEISEHNLDTQLDALDEELDAFEDAQDKKLKELEESTDAQIKLLKTSATEQEKVIDDMLQIVTDNYSTAFENITSIASDYGIKIAEAITNPLKNIDLLSSGNSFSASSDSSSTITKSTKKTIKSILKNGDGKGGVSSDLNKYVMSEYGNGSKYLSFAQMAELALLLGIGSYSAKEFKGNDTLKNKLLTALKNAGFSGGGEISSSGSIFGNDNILLRAKKGEFILTQDMTKDFKQLVNNLPQINNYNNLSQNIIDSIKSPSGINNGNYHIDSILKIENVEGDVGDGVKREIESMLSGLDIEKQLNKIVNKNK